MGMSWGAVTVRTSLWFLKSYTELPSSFTPLTLTTKGLKTPAHYKYIHSRVLIRIFTTVKRWGLGSDGKYPSEGHVSELLISSWWHCLGEVMESLEGRTLLGEVRRCGWTLRLYSFILLPVTYLSVCPSNCLSVHPSIQLPTSLSPFCMYLKM